MDTAAHPVLTQAQQAVSAGSVATVAETNRFQAVAEVVRAENADAAEQVGLADTFPVAMMALAAQIDPVALATDFEHEDFDKVCDQPVLAHL